MKKKLLLIFLHGFGDNIMATPAVKELSEIYDIDVVIYDKTLGDKLWENLDFVNKVYSLNLPNHPRYWNPIAFWLKDYWMVKKAVKKAVDVKQYDKVIFSKIYALPHIAYVLAPFLLRRHHKIDQIAYDVGIKHLKSKKTLIQIPDEFNKKTDDFLEKHNVKPDDIIITLHLLTVAIERDFPLALAQRLIDTLSKKHKNLKFIILGAKSTYYDEEKRYKTHLKGNNVIHTFTDTSNEHILTTASLIRKSKVFLGIDSGPLHIAGALNVNTMAIFRTTRITSDQRVAFNKNVWCYDSKNIDLDFVVNKMEDFIK